MHHCPPKTPSPTRSCVHAGEVLCTTPTGLVARSEGAAPLLPCSLVVHCTGHATCCGVFDAAVRAQLAPRKEGLHLFRSLVPPLVRGLAFVGVEVGKRLRVARQGSRGGA